MRHKLCIVVATHWSLYRAEREVTGCECEETGDVTWSLMAPRACDKVDDEAETLTAACINIDDEVHQPAAAADTELTEPTAVDDSSDVKR